MQAYLSCVWSVVMTSTVIFFLFPNIVFCHLVSALRAGTGALTKFTLGDQIVYCTFTNLGEGRPPTLSHVRVSREPQLRVNRNDELSGGFSGHPQMIRIKSPSYQHKVLQFHSNGQTSSGGQDYFPSKLIIGQPHGVKASPTYPVPSMFGKVDSRHLIGRTSTGGVEDNGSEEGGDSWEIYSNNWEPQLLPEPEDPTFTPYIGARALTNIPKFFEHLRENIVSLYEDKARESAANDHQLTSSGTKGEEDVDKSLPLPDTEDIKFATPTRRGYSSTSESQNEHPSALIDAWTLRNSRSKPYTLGGQPVHVNREVDEKTRELLHFLGQTRPQFPKANRYNPGWLFTNLGLGKRNHLGVTK